MLVEAMSCGLCVNHVKEALSQLDGINKCRYKFKSIGKLDSILSPVILCLFIL
jgi:copper chaperone CopZ